MWTPGVTTDEVPTMTDGDAETNHGGHGPDLEIDTKDPDPEDETQGGQENIPGKGHLPDHLTRKERSRRIPRGTQTSTISRTIQPTSHSVSSTSTWSRTPTTKTHFTSSTLRWNPAGSLKMLHVGRSGSSGLLEIEFSEQSQE